MLSIKKIFIPMVCCAFFISTNAQDVVLFQDVLKDSLRPVFGQNLHLPTYIVGKCTFSWRRSISTNLQRVVHRALLRVAGEE